MKSESIRITPAQKAALHKIAMTSPRPEDIHPSTLSALLSKDLIMVRCRKFFPDQVQLMPLGQQMHRKFFPKGGVK